MTAILDTNHDTTAHLPALKTGMYTHLIRYIATGSKSITPAEAHAIAAAGILLATVYEGWGDTHGELDAAAGTRHAQEYLAKAAAIGQPLGSAMYFAVDADESPARIRSNILPYFQAIKAVIGSQFRVGVYGSGNVCAAVMDAGYASLGWLSNAQGWGGYAAFKASGRWCLLQHLPATIAGLDTDPDEINPARPDIGAFIPYGEAPSIPVETDALWIQKELNRRGAAPPLLVDGNIGPRSLAAIRKFIQAADGATF